MAGRTRPFLFYRDFRKRSRGRVAALTATAIIATRLHELRRVGFAPGRTPIAALVLTTLAMAVFASTMFRSTMFGGAMFVLTPFRCLSAFMAAIAVLMLRSR